MITLLSCSCLLLPSLWVRVSLRHSTSPPLLPLTMTLVWLECLLSHFYLPPQTGTNADIEFSFTIANDYFSIDETTGVVTTATELDREEIAEHQLSIQVERFPTTSVTQRHGLICRHQTEPSSLRQSLSQ